MKQQKTKCKYKWKCWWPNLCSFDHSYLYKKVNNFTKEDLEKENENAKVVATESKDEPSLECKNCQASGYETSKNDKEKRKKEGYIMLQPGLKIAFNDTYCSNITKHKADKKLINLMKTPLALKNLIKEISEEPDNSIIQGT